jgi:hypothetical protein
MNMNQTQQQVAYHLSCLEVLYSCYHVYVRERSSEPMNPGPILLTCIYIFYIYLIRTITTLAFTSFIHFTIVFI